MFLTYPKVGKRKTAGKRNIEMTKRRLDCLSPAGRRFESSPDIIHHVSATLYQYFTILEILLPI